MLHLARGIALGMDVADFLELQRTFEPHRKIGATAEVKHVPRGRDEMRHARNLLVVVERRVEGGRRLLEVPDDLALVLIAEAALGPRKVRRERGQHRELASKR